jgi:hypothetical protein
MSASEKLKALKQQLDSPFPTVVWHAQEIEKRVLPQIVAVVEAAEKLWQVHGEIAAWEQGTDLIAALVALDAKFGEE